MDEEMAELDVNATWELVVLPKDKKGSNGCTKSNTMQMDM
jgi:hypothetical protein